MLTSHYLACFWHYVSDDRPPITAGHSVIAAYVADFYYAVCLIQGQGNTSDEDSNVSENVFSIVAVLVGSVILAIVFGNVAMLVANFNANTTNYQRKIEAVFATMNKLHLPEPLRDRIHQYYTHLWTEYESLDGDIVKFSNELTHPLALEVGLFRYMNLVLDIPFWRECSPDFITQIVLLLAVRVYLPDDYVIRKGEIGDELFMLNRGICEITEMHNALHMAEADPQDMEDMDHEADHQQHNEDDDQDEAEHRDSVLMDADDAASGESGAAVRVRPMSPLLSSSSGSSAGKKHLSSREVRIYPGQAFGEMSLLMNYERTANIRAVTHAEVCVLARAPFQQLLARYKADRRVVLREILQSCIERNEIPFPWEQLLLHTDKAKLQTMTSSQVAEALTEFIDVELADESIKYGFQAFNVPHQTARGGGGGGGGDEGGAPSEAGATDGDTTLRDFSLLAMSDRSSTAADPPTVAGLIPTAGGGRVFVGNIGGGGDGVEMGRDTRLMQLHDAMETMEQTTTAKLQELEQSQTQTQAFVRQMMGMMTRMTQQMEHMQHALTRLEQKDKQQQEQEKDKDKDKDKKDEDEEDVSLLDSRSDTQRSVTTSVSYGAKRRLPPLNLDAKTSPTKSASTPDRELKSSSSLPSPSLSIAPQPSPSTPSPPKQQSTLMRMLTKRRSSSSQIQVTAAEVTTMESAEKQPTHDFNSSESLVTTTAKPHRRLRALSDQFWSKSSSHMDVGRRPKKQILMKRRSRSFVGMFWRQDATTTATTTTRTRPTEV